MKLVTYFDLEDAIYNVNNSFGLYKIVRNNRKRWLGSSLPLYAAIDYACWQDIEVTLQFLALQFGMVLSAEVMGHLLTQNDIYQLNSCSDLKRLVASLQELNISTDYSLLSQSEVYDNRVHVEFNSSKIPEVVSSKYILIPSYDFHGKIVDTSIEQEHVMGSREYILSLGSPSKNYRKVCSFA